MNNKKEKNYISPEVEVMTIEVEQSILNGSYDIERLERLNEQEW